MMKIFGKRVLPLLLALCMLLSLAACGKGKQEDTAEDLSATVYVPEFLDTDFVSKNGYFYGGCTDGQYAYMLVAHYPDWEAGEEGDTTYQILRMPLDGGTPEPLTNFKPDEKPEGYDYAYSGVNGISAGANGTLWVEEYVSAYSFDLPEGFDPEQDNYWEYDVLDSIDGNYLIQLDSNGNEITRINVSELQEKIDASGFYSDGQRIDKDGDLFVVTDEKIVALDSSLNILFEIETDNFWGEIVLLGDGTVGSMVTESDAATNTYTRAIKVIDKSTKDWGEAYVLPNDVYRTYDGGGDYLFYYMKGQSLYGYKTETAEGEDPNTFLVNLLDADISVDDLEFFSFLEDGRIVVMARAYGSGSSGSGLTLAVLTPTPRSEIPEKTVLTYATMYLSQDERNKIVNFNRTNAKYRIQVKDYSEYRTEEDYMAGIQKLNTEILAEQVPDIISCDSLPIRQYGAKGLLEDLWPYIESDPDIGGRAGLMERPLAASEQDGKLYQIFDSFGIVTLVGAKSVVGDRNSWTLADLQAALDSMPEGCALFDDYATKSEVLAMVLYMNLDSFVDWNEGKCRFDSDQFKNLLAFADKFPLEWESNNSGEYDDEYTRISEGRQMLMQESVSRFEDIQMQRAVFGGEISYIGFPVEDGSVGSCFTADNGLAMSSVCADKEGAWSFMRQVLLPQYANQDEDSFFHVYGLPTNKADFDFVVKQAMTPDGYQLDENGEKVLDEDGNPIEESHSSWGIGNSLTIDIYATKQEEVDQIMDLYNKVDRMASIDSNVYDIVNEVAGSYFAGDRSLDDAAGLIQNKVTTYVNESR